MAGILTYEFYEADKAATGKQATIDPSTGLVYVNQLPTPPTPPTVTTDFLGNYADLTALQTAYPTGADYGVYGYCNKEKYYWNAAMVPAAWTSVNITAAAYTALTAEQKAGQPEFNITS